MIKHVRLVIKLPAPLVIMDCIFKISPTHQGWRSPKGQCRRTRHPWPGCRVWLLLVWCPDSLAPSTWRVSSLQQYRSCPHSLLPWVVQIRSPWLRVCLYRFHLITHSWRLNGGVGPASKTTNCRNVNYHSRRWRLLMGTVVIIFPEQFVVYLECRRLFEQQPWI